MTFGTHVILSGSYRAAVVGARRIADVDPDARMEVILDLKSQGVLPTTHETNTWSLDRLKDTFAASRATVAAVTESLSRLGLKVTGQPAVTPSLYVTGRAADMELAFKPGLGIYRAADQGPYVGRRAGPCAIPAELRGLVLGVHGLDDRQVLRRRPRVRTAAAKDARKVPGLTPSQIAQRYNFPAGSGANQKIAVAEFGGAFFQDDLDSFCAEFGLPANQVVVKNAGAAPAPAPSVSQLDYSGEVNMDIQIIVGLCPAAEVTVYFSHFKQSGLVSLLDAVIADLPAVLSVSYGQTEDDQSQWSATALASINNRLNAARLAGITVCVSTGDDGTGCDMFDGGVHVEFPSTSPYVLAVGGTMISEAGAETSWWETPGTRFEPGSAQQTGGGSSGGGVSDKNPRPEWQEVQVTSLNPSSANGRIVPDVAALAGSPGSACLMRELQSDGSVAKVWEPGEGTSAATPIWAALVARINAVLPANKQQRSVGELLYQSTPGGTRVACVGCVPTTAGHDNASLPDPGIGYAIGGPFNAVTGWGVPDGQKLSEALALV